MLFKKCFEAAFNSGLSDIKFFVRRGESVTVSELKDDALAFQVAISAGDVKEVESVD